MSRYQPLSKNLRQLLMASATGAALLTALPAARAIEPAQHRSPNQNSSVVAPASHDSVGDRLKSFYGKAKAKVTQPFTQQHQPSAQTPPKRNFFDKLVGRIKGENSPPQAPPQDPGMYYPTASGTNHLQPVSPPAGSARQPAAIPPKPLANLPSQPGQVALPNPVTMTEEPRQFPADDSSDHASSTAPPLPSLFAAEPPSPKAFEATEQKPVPHPFDRFAGQPDQLPVIQPKGGTAAQPPLTASHGITREQFEAFENALEPQSQPDPGQFAPPVLRSSVGRPVLDLEEVLTDAKKSEASMVVNVVEPQIPDIAPLPAAVDIPMPDPVLDSFFPNDNSSIPPSPDAFPEESLSLDAPPAATLEAAASTEQAPLPPAIEDEVEEPHTGLALEKNLFEDLPLPPVAGADLPPSETLTAAPGLVQLEPTATKTPSVSTELPASPPKLEASVDKTKEQSQTDLEQKIASRAASGLKGFCPVALRDQRELLDGNEKFLAVFGGKEYTFSSPQALEKFLANPEKYAPARNGQDVIHHALTGENMEGSLDHAVWYKGQLFLFNSVETMETFMAAPVKDPFK